MTWGRMDDKFHRNDKVRELRKSKEGRLALGTWVFWWSWCLDDRSLSGVVPAIELSASEMKCAELLVACGLWDRVDGGFRFHNFHRYNPTKQQRLKKLERDRAGSASRRAEAARVARDVAGDYEATSPPRARVGRFRTCKSDLLERDLCNTELEDLTAHARAKAALEALQAPEPSDSPLKAPGPENGSAYDRDVVSPPGRLHARAKAISGGIR